MIPCGGRIGERLQDRVAHGMRSPPGPAAADLRERPEGLERPEAAYHGGLRSFLAESDPLARIRSHH